MPQATGRADATRAVVFAPLDGAGRAELVEQRLTDAIVAGVLARRRAPAERVRARPQPRRRLVTAREALRGAARQGPRAAPGADATAAAS